MRLPALFLLVCAACGAEEAPPLLPTSPPDRLSAWGLFSKTGVDLALAEGVIPFAVNASLFTDYADKQRFLRLPKAGVIEYSDTEAWGFPTGTVIGKTFAFGPRRIETRLLVRETEGFAVHVYRWNDDQKDAQRLVVGAELPVERRDDEGALHAQAYRIPNLNQCKTCHAGAGDVDVLGPRTRQLDRDFEYPGARRNQLDHLAALGLLSAEPAPRSERQRLVDPHGEEGGIDDRARAYLDANCGHCHRPEGDAASSGLWLGTETVDRHRLGVCKIPIAAGRGAGGREFDVVPGQPDASILVYRMEATEPDIRMPELGRSVVDARGVALIRAWITQMPPESCD
jgi:uncharacterized repeat protein (TIGR03806 family)